MSEQLEIDEIDTDSSLESVPDYAKTKRLIIKLIKTNGHWKIKDD